MSCFPCFGSKKSAPTNEELPRAEPTRPQNITSPPPPVHTSKEIPSSNANQKAEAVDSDDGAKAFTFRELASATKNFRQECLLGEGGFGRVFRATLQSSGQIVAVRQLDRSGTQGNREFIVEVSRLSLLHHPNLVSIIGYCADGDQRLLVYEYMPSGSLKNHLFDITAGKKPLDWSTRMKIAAGVGQGLEYLHEKANPPIIYRDLKSSNILLDEMNNPRLSEYGLAKLVQSGNTMHVSPTVMAAYGYCAPEYETQGELTLKSDVYSFGVVLLELITGRRALDTTRPPDEQNLVSWAQSFFRDPKRFPDMADPLLKNQFPVTSLNQAVGVAAMCLNEEPSVRPLIGDIVAALSFLAMAPPEAPIPPRLAPILSTRADTMSGYNGNVNSKREWDTKEDSSNNENGDKKMEHLKKHEQDGAGSSDSDSDASSIRSDHEDRFKESKKKGSSSKVRSRSKGSLSSSGRSSRSNSFGLKDYSIGFSLPTSDSAHPEHPSDPHQESDAGSCSDDENDSDDDHGSSAKVMIFDGSHSRHNRDDGDEYEGFNLRRDQTGGSTRSHEGSKNASSRHNSSMDSESDNEDPHQ